MCPKLAESVRPAPSASATTPTAAPLDQLAHQEPLATPVSLVVRESAAHLVSQEWPSNCPRRRLVASSAHLDPQDPPAHLAHLVAMEREEELATPDPMVTQATLDPQDPQDRPERRAQMARLESPARPEPLAPVEPRDQMDPQDPPALAATKDHQDRLDSQEVTDTQAKLDPRDRPDRPELLETRERPAQPAHRPNQARTPLTALARAARRRPPRQLAPLRRLLEDAVLAPESAAAMRNRAGALFEFNVTHDCSTSSTIVDALVALHVIFIQIISTSSQ